MSIYSIISDSKVSEELSSCLKNRNLEQKFLYHWKWADLYYDYKDHKDELMHEEEEDNEINIPEFWHKNCFLWDKRISLISLWCGNAVVDKHIYSTMSDESLMEFIGVDLSKEMLFLAEKNLENVDTKKKFVCADFSSLDFKNEIQNITTRGQKRVFSFFSNTFWNINHTNIIDTLYDILSSWDQIWLDVRLRKSKKVKDDMNIFNLVQIEWLEEFLTSPFRKSKIPMENGELSKVMKKEEWINSLKVEFYFNFTEKTQIDMKGQITFLPWESIKCLQIYYYDAESLIHFFTEHNFKFIDKEIKWLRGQFLFEKE